MIDLRRSGENRLLREFVEKLKIDKSGILLLTENSLTVLVAMKKKDKEFSFDLLIDCLIEKIGDTGTLLIQTFDWRFCKGEEFDILKSKSQTSFLGNTALKRHDFIRTKHPIYSFAVTGKYKDELANLTNIGAFDINSPFHFIHKKKANMIIIDVPLQSSFTFVHYVEEIEQVSYRYNKRFKSIYIDELGVKSIKSYEMYVRDIENNVVTDFEPLEELLLENKALESYVVDNLVIRKIDLSKAYPVIVNDIRNNMARSLFKIGQTV